jgi:predicted CxxxxCH...CXXCH cytochrome family protein
MSSPTTFSAPQKHIDGTVDVTMVHPAGYDAREQHGYDFDKMGQSTCATASCHGTALTGGTTGGPSCNSCHTGWQTNCTFCHGGTDNTTGAPPQDVLNTNGPAIGAHTIHVNQTTRHAAWDCNYCHTKPSSALTPGHIDGTGGVVQAEVLFSSLNPAGTFTQAALTCNNMYCHGTGVAGTTGTAPAWGSTTQLACVDGCHGGSPSYTNMSSGHRRSDHKKSCATCHKNVVDANNNIINLSLHVNGARDVQFQNTGSTYNPTNKSCTGTGNGCHGNGTQTGW